MRGKRLEFYESARGKSPVEDFVLGLRDAQLINRVRRRLERLDKYGYRDRDKYLKPVKGYKPLWEDRVKHIRFLFFECPNGKIVLLHGFKKKRGRTRKQHPNTALERMHNYLERKR